MPTEKLTQRQYEQHMRQQQLVPQHVPVRRVLFRNKALEARGLRVVCVPYFDWMLYQTWPRRRHYLKKLLREANRVEG
jgi:hypothetical protein